MEEWDNGFDDSFVTAVPISIEIAPTGVQPTFRRPLGRELGRCCLRSNGLQPHCQQSHLAVIVVSPSVRFAVRRKQRTSDDDIIVSICWELGDLVVDRSIGLSDDDGEK